MKKLLTLALALLVVVCSYSQVRKVSKSDAKNKVATMQVTKGMEDFENVQSEPVMTRSDGELDFTIYDLQTNWAAINRTIVWPDGKVNFAYIIATEESYADCGTGIGTYDSNNDEWIPSGARVENERTSFGSIARYKENSIIVAAQTASECGLYLIENKDEISQCCAITLSKLNNDKEPRCPVVMTSGSNRDIIHIIATGYDNRLYYYRSNDGMTWDKENVILPYLTEEYGSYWGNNTAYWMETTQSNCLALVVNNPWSDGMVIYSYDDGETWERKLFYQHPGINTTFDYWFKYPRWTSAQWGVDGELCLAYEFNCTTGEPGSVNYDPSVGGVAFWSETLPYHGNTPPFTPDQPFIMDYTYLEDLYASWHNYYWSTQEIWPEFMGYPLSDYDSIPSWNIEDFSLHGDYNCGPVAMPVLTMLPDIDGSAMVAVWCAMDEKNTDINGNYFFKLFASCSLDGGRTWTPQTLLTTDFLWTSNEFVYPQAAVIGMNLIVAVQTDSETGTFVQGDEDPYDNFYQGFTFDLSDLLPPVPPPGVQENEHNTHVTVYPNPAAGQLIMTLNKNAEVTVCNILGQTVMTLEGRVGVNRLDISNLNAGVYFVKASSDTQKFIVK